MRSEIYVVWGGVFRDNSFSELESGTEEMYGPFATLEEAERVQDGMMRKNIDICWCPTSGPMGQVWVVEERRISGSS